MDIDYMVITAGDGNEQCVYNIEFVTSLPYRKLIYVLQNNFADHILEPGRPACRVFCELENRAERELLQQYCPVRNLLLAPEIIVSLTQTRITYFQGASATVTFEGNTIALYGTVNNDHGLFGVSIDGGTQTNFDGKAPEPRFQMLLVSAFF